MTALRDARRERFCHEYLKDRDVRAAALRAGYPRNRNLCQSVKRLRKSAAIQARIVALQDAIAAEAKAEAEARADADWVVAELLKIARADPRKFFNADGVPRKVHELGDEEAAALSAFESTGEAGKVVDRLKVLELLGRHFGLWPQKPAPADTNLFEGMSLDDVRRIRDKVGRLLAGPGGDLAGGGPPRGAR